MALLDSHLRPVARRCRRAVNIPVIGGFGADHGSTAGAARPHRYGYAEKWIDAKTDTYVNTSPKAALEAFTALIADARASRQIKG